MSVTPSGVENEALLYKPPNKNEVIVGNSGAGLEATLASVSGDNFPRADVVPEVEATEAISSFESSRKKPFFDLPQWFGGMQEHRKFACLRPAALRADIAAGLDLTAEVEFGPSRYHLAIDGSLLAALEILLKEAPPPPPSFVEGLLCRLLSRQENMVFPGILELCKLLLEQGAKTDPQDYPGGYTALHFAVTSDNVGVVDWLCHLPAEQRPSPAVRVKLGGYNAFHLAIMHGNMTIISLLRESFSENSLPTLETTVGPTSESALHLAVAAGQSKVVDYLLSIHPSLADWPLDSLGANCLMRAIEVGNWTLAIHLITTYPELCHFASPKTGLTPLMNACRFHDKFTGAATLRQPRTDRTEGLSAEACSIDVVASLLLEGVQVGEQDLMGKNALWYALSSGPFPLVTVGENTKVGLLLRHGARVSDLDGLPSPLPTFSSSASSSSFASFGKSSHSHSYLDVLKEAETRLVTEEEKSIYHVTSTLRNVSCGILFPAERERVIAAARKNQKRSNISNIKNSVDVLEDADL